MRWRSAQRRIVLVRHTRAWAISVHTDHNFCRNAMVYRRDTPNSDFARVTQATLTLTRHSCISVCASVNAFATFMCFLSRGERDRWQILLWSIPAGSLFTCLWYHFAASIGKSRVNERERERGACRCDSTIYTCIHLDTLSMHQIAQA